MTTTRYVEVFRRYVRTKGGGRWDVQDGVARPEDGKPTPWEGHTLGIYRVEGAATSGAAIGAVFEWLIRHRPAAMTVYAEFEV